MLIKLISMKILFIHPSFPAQFQYLASLLSFTEAFEIRSISNKTPTGLGNIIQYRCGSIDDSMCSNECFNHPINGIRRGKSIEEFCGELNAKGYIPDIVIAHPRWGHSLFVKNVWPSCKLVLYLEYYFNGFLLKDTYANKKKLYQDIQEETYKNVIMDMSFTSMDAAIAPTEFQKSTFPARIQDKIDVIHDGINTKSFSPDPNVVLNIGGRMLTKKNKILTFVSRSLEPIRGFPSFMRCLPEVLSSDPEIIVLIVGSFQVSYGRDPQSGMTWQKMLKAEIQDTADINRIIFLENVCKETTLKVFQISTVHVHLSLPFTLSWSILEAMSVGCAIVSSKGFPVEEVIEDKTTGVLVNINEFDVLAKKVIMLFSDPVLRLTLGLNARQKVIDNFDAMNICFPRHFNWLQTLMNSNDLAEQQSFSVL